jgi:DNA modification methylase
LKLSSVHVNPANPRLIKDDRFKKLVKSIKEFPKMMDLRPIIVDKDGLILGGNMRFKALQELGYKDVPDEWVKRADELTEVEKREFIIKDNVGFGENDWDVLANEWDQEKLIEWGLEIPDFAINKPEAIEDDFEIPDETKTDIVLGDLFEIGQHRLLCGDSTDSDQVAKLMNGQKADMVFTDPPYGVNYEGGLNKKKRDKLIGDETGELYHGVLSAALPFCKSSAAWYLWFAGTIGKPVYEAVESAGMKVRAMIVWNKQNAHYGNFMAQYMQKHEPCLYCFKDSPKWYGATNEVTVWDVIQPAKNEHHPTQKPVELAVRGINNSSKEEDIITDFFLGSGTTMVASHQLNRKCYGMEIDPKYCQVIIDRMRKLDPEIVIKKNGVLWQSEKQPEDQKQ